ncbi:neuroendocrine convertase 1-like [Chelonus insularis]|nr:neuroendocrine convertase 1-like [Chelonus insularis]
MKCQVLVYLCLIFLVKECTLTTTNSTLKNSYIEEWVVKIEGGPQVATLLALQSGYKNLGLVLGFENTYLWIKDPRQISKRGHSGFNETRLSNFKILWADQQKAFKRHKRDFITLDSEKPLIREKRILTFDNNNYLNDLEDHHKNQQMFNDELWMDEWYLQDTRSNKDLPKLDLNVLPLYHQGITGYGVKVAVLDDGLEYTHEDLKNNYDPTISYDVNERDNDPIPRYEVTGTNAHGTRCAGEIAMEANNHKCGVGVAFEASIGGIKLLDGIVNDRVEGEALGYKQDLIDIYTASWGPADDGKSLEAPGRLATEALERGVLKGRNGRGNIYLWASGNGGSKEDNCGCDGYVNSIYTISVGSASQTGKFPWYGERCPATLATTYSSGAYYDQMIATTDLKNECTTRHTGTSASAPLAAGILALALQVNKELTWRDAQHLVVKTSEYNPLKHNPGWKKNSAGFWFNPRFGFGLMNAHALVYAAANWTNVPEKRKCFVQPLHYHSQALVYGSPTALAFNVNECSDKDTKVSFLEHVQVETTIKYTIRGALRMHLTSATGTRVEILNPRKFDTSDEGFIKWKFMSVATWGEDPRGIWKLEIVDKIGPKTNKGTIENITLIIHGTEDPPFYRLNKKNDKINNNINNINKKKNKHFEIMRDEIENDREKEENKWNEANNEINDFTEEVIKPVNFIQVDWLRRFLFGWIN